MGKIGTIITAQEYDRIHKWIRSHYGVATRCENLECECKYERFEWALKTGKEYKKNRDNFIMLCTSCHRKMDITNEFRDKMSKAMSNRVSSHAKAVIGTNKSGGIMYVFSSAARASLAFNKKVSRVSQSIVKKHKAAGFKWEYLRIYPKEQALLKKR